MIVVSDGWDRGDPALVAAETARLRRNCHRLVWLNPLASSPGYQPLAAGMKAAFPFIDDFLPAGTLASLERLGEVLAGASAGNRPAGIRRNACDDRHAVAGPACARTWTPPTASSRRRGPGRGALADGRGSADRPRRTHACRSWSTRSTAGAPREPGSGRAVVVRTFGCAPRPEGAVLLVTDDGRLAGSVSGGCVEGAAAEEIWAARKHGRERVIRYGISDEQAWDVGLACGGTIDVLVSPGRPGRGARRRPRDARRPRRRTGHRHAASRRMRRQRRSARTRRATARRPAAPLVVHDDGRLDGTLGDPDADAALVDAAARDALRTGTSKTVEVARRASCSSRRTRCGRGSSSSARSRCARTLVRLAKDLGYETVVIDGRAAFATEARFPDVDRLIVGWPDEVADEIGLGPGDAVAVLTHDVKFDEPAIVDGARARLPLRRRGRIEEDPGRPARAAARRRASRPRSSTGSAGRSASTSAGACRPRRPSRSSPRSSRSGGAAAGGRCASSPASGRPRPPPVPSARARA